jgi:hypothetical protein
MRAPGAKIQSLITPHHTPNAHDLGYVAGSTTTGRVSDPRS